MPGTFNALIASSRHMAPTKGRIQPCSLKGPLANVSQVPQRYIHSPWHCTGRKSAQPLAVLVMISTFFCKKFEINCFLPSVSWMDPLAGSLVKASGASSLILVGSAIGSFCMVSVRTACQVSSYN